MNNPSPRSHLYRLGSLLVVGLVGFLVIKAVATPSSWNYTDWYRGDSTIEIAAQPLIYGGNESCRDCHDYEHKSLLEFKHKTLSCESCHGALADHIEEGKKVAAAQVDDAPWQCLNCHSEQINRPKAFPQFSDKVDWHQGIGDDIVCIACHDVHDPAL